MLIGNLSSLLVVANVVSANSSLSVTSPSTFSQEFNSHFRTADADQQARTEPTLASRTVSSIRPKFTSLSDGYPSLNIEQRFNYSMNNNDSTIYGLKLSTTDQLSQLDTKNLIAQQPDQRQVNLTSKLIRTIINPISEALLGSSFLISDQDSSSQESSKNHDLGITGASFASDKNHMGPFVSKELELSQTTFAPTSFPSTSVAAIGLEISTLLPPPYQPSEFPVSQPISTVVPSSLSATATTTSTNTTIVTTTLGYNGLNGTDPYAFTTEARYFSLPIVIQILMFLLYGTLAFTAVASNMIVCYIVLSNQRMRTATNYFIVNLAVGDILMALLCIPFTFPSNLVFQYWPFGLSLCVMVSYSQANSVFVSAYTMVAISIDKYIAIMYPMRLRMPKIQAKIIILVIWSAALITSLPTALLSILTPASPDMISPNQPTGIINSSPNLQMSNQNLGNNNSQARAQKQKQNNSSSSLTSSPDSTYHTFLSSTESSAEVFSTSPTENKQNIEQHHDEQTKYFCQENWSFWPSGQYYYSMALMVLQFVIPLFVLVITYTRIVIVVWGKKMPGEEDNARDARMARSKRKMIKMVIFCVIAFALTWLPFNALIVIGDVNPDIWEYQNIMYIWFITHYLAMCHTITNPLIYIWMNNRFRAGFRKVIKDLFRPFRQASACLFYHCVCLRLAFKCSDQKYSRVANSVVRNRGVPVRIVTSSSSVNNTNINAVSSINTSNNKSYSNNVSRNNNNTKNGANISKTTSLADQQAGSETKSKLAASSQPFSVATQRLDATSRLETNSSASKAATRERELERHTHFSEAMIRSNDRARRQCKVNNGRAPSGKTIEDPPATRTKMVAAESDLEANFSRIVSNRTRETGLASDSRLSGSVNLNDVGHSKGDFTYQKRWSKSDQSLEGAVESAGRGVAAPSCPSEVFYSEADKEAKNCPEECEVSFKGVDKVSEADGRNNGAASEEKNLKQAREWCHEGKESKESKSRRKRKKHSHSICIQMTSTEYHGSKSRTRTGYLVESSSSSSKRKDAKVLSKPSEANLVRIFGSQKKRAASISSVDVSACPACRSGTDKQLVGDITEIGGDRRDSNVDMRQSSQSTATVSMQTNTTSLAISPLYSIQTNNDSPRVSSPVCSNNARTSSHFDASRSLDSTADGRRELEKQRRRTNWRQRSFSSLSDPRHKINVTKFKSTERLPLVAGRLKLASDTCLIKWQFDLDRKRQSLSSSRVTPTTDSTTYRTMVPKRAGLECPSCDLTRKCEKAPSPSPRSSESSLLHRAKQSFCSKHQFASNSLTDDDVCDVFQASNSNNQNQNQNYVRIGDRSQTSRHQVRENGSLELLSDQFDEDTTSAEKCEDEEEVDKSLIEEYGDEDSPLRTVGLNDLEMVCLKSRRISNQPSCGAQQLNAATTTTDETFRRSSGDNQSWLRNNMTHNVGGGNGSINGQRSTLDVGSAVGDGGERGRALSKEYFASLVQQEVRPRKRTTLLGRFPVSCASNRTSSVGGLTNQVGVGQEKETGAIQTGLWSQSIASDRDRGFHDGTDKTGQSNSSRLRNQSSSASVSVSVPALAGKATFSLSANTGSEEGVVAAENSFSPHLLKLARGEESEKEAGSRAKSLASSRVLHSSFNQAEANSCRVRVSNEDLLRVGRIEPLKQGEFGACPELEAKRGRAGEGKGEEVIDTYLSLAIDDSRETRFVRKSPTVYLINKTKSQENNVFEGQQSG